MSGWGGIGGGRRVERELLTQMGEDGKGMEAAGASGVFMLDNVNKQCIHSALDTVRVQLYRTLGMEIERLKRLARADVVVTHDCPQRIVTASDAEGPN